MFNFVSMFGCTSRITYIRAQSTYWAKARKVIDQLNPLHLQRATLDNLNFKRKYAKTYKTEGHCDGRQLNLITGQVSHRSTCNSNINKLNLPASTVNSGSFFYPKDTNEHDAIEI